MRAFALSSLLVLLILGSPLSADPQPPAAEAIPHANDSEADDTSSSPRETSVPAEPTVSTLTAARFNKLFNLDSASPSTLTAALRTLTPWQCDPATGGKTQNLHQAAAVILRKKLKDPGEAAFKKSYEALSQEATQLWGEALSVGNSTKLAQIAYQFRFSEHGDKAVDSLITLLSDHADYFTASLFFDGWAEDHPSELCSEKWLATTAKGLLAYANSQRREPLEKLTAKLADCKPIQLMFAGKSLPKADLDRSLSNQGLFKKGFFSTPAWQEMLSDASPDLKTWVAKTVVKMTAPPSVTKPWLLKDSDPEALSRKGLLKYALAYSNQSDAFLSRFQKEKPIAKHLSLCDHLEPTAAADRVVDGYGPLVKPLPGVQSALEALYPAEWRTRLDPLATRFVNNLEGDDYALRAQAKTNLARMGKVAVPALKKGLAEGSESKTQLAILLSEIPGEFENAAPHLLAGLRHYDQDLSASALQALNRSKSNITPLLLESLKSDPADPHGYALRVLCARAKQNVELLQASLKSDKEDVRQFAAIAISNTEKAEEAVPELMKAVHHPSPKVRLAAIDSLGAMGKKAEAALPELIEHINDNQPHVGMAAQSALVRIGPAAFPYIRPLLKSEDYELQVGMIMLGQLGSASKDAIPELVTKLNHERWVMRDSAVDALARIGADGVPALERAMKSKSPRISKAATLALGRVEGHASKYFDQTVAIIKNSDFSEEETSRGEKPADRYRAIRNLEGMKDKAKDSVPLLMSLIDDKDAYVRELAVTTLGYLGEAGAPAAPKMIAIWTGSNRSAQERVGYALTQMGIAVKPALEAALKSENPAVREKAAKTLERIEADVRRAARD